MKIHPNSVWRRRLDGKLVTVQTVDDYFLDGGCPDVEVANYRFIVKVARQQFLSDYFLADVHPVKKMLIHAAVLAGRRDQFPLLALADALEEQGDPDAVYFRTLLEQSPTKAANLVIDWAGVIEW